jgi:hypothetical protein
LWKTFREDGAQKNFYVCFEAAAKWKHPSQGQQADTAATASLKNQEIYLPTDVIFYKSDK